NEPGEDRRNGCWLGGGSGADRTARQRRLSRECPVCVFAACTGRVSENARSRWNHRQLRRSGRALVQAIPAVRDSVAASTPVRTSFSARQQGVGGGLQRGEGLRRRIEPAELTKR